MRYTLAAALFAACAAPTSAQGADERAWPSTLTMHFDVHHASGHLPNGYLIRLEDIHARIARELWFLDAGLRSEKIDFYLYADKDSYLAGSFHPPSWSLAISETRPHPNNQKLFVTYMGANDTELAHELTHLFFHAYWVRADGMPPPHWLDEGLAVLMEGRQRPLNHPLPLKRFLAAAPERDDAAARVSDWYAQAGSVVRFLFETRGASRFRSWCESLKEGEPLEDDLRHVYGFYSIDDLEKEWRLWAGAALKGTAGTR